MAPKIRKTPEVFDDLDGIAAFIAHENPVAAIRFLDHLEGKFALLAASPAIGRPCPELAPDLRGFPTRDYIILYRELPGGIEIARVLHAARDIQALFDT